MQYYCLAFYCDLYNFRKHKNSTTTLQAPNYGTCVLPRIDLGDNYSAIFCFSLMGIHSHVYTPNMHTHTQMYVHAHVYIYNVIISKFKLAILMETCW